MLNRISVTQRVLRLLPSGSFRRHVAVLSGASVVAQAIQLIATPILTRLYSPEAFGDWTLIMTIVGIGTAFGGGRYELGILAAEDEKEAWCVACVQFICNIVTCLAAFLLLLVFGRLLGIALNREHLASWFLAAPFIMFWTVLATDATYWFLRHGEFHSMSMYRVMLAAITAILPILVYPLCNGQTSGLILGSIVGPCSILVTIALSMRKDGDGTHIGHVSRYDLWNAFIRYRKFLLFTVPYGLVSAGRERGVVVVLGLYAARTVVGYYGQVLRVMYLPVGLIGTAINSVVLQRASSMTDRHALEKLVSHLLITLSLFAIPGFLFVAWFGEELFAFVLGAEWREAGGYASILVLPAFSMLLVTSTDKMLEIIDRQGVAFLIELLYSVAGLSGVAYACVFQGDTFLAIALFAIALFAGHLARLYAVYRFWRFPHKALFRVAGLAALLAGGFALFFIVAERCCGQSQLFLFTVASAGVLAYYLVVVVVSWSRSIAHTQGSNA